MAVIKNFGVLWERKHIDWGQRGRGGVGTLLGHCAKSKKKLVNFRKQAGVYVLYDENKVPVYVGQADSNHSLFSRLRNHTSDHLRSRWEYFSWLGMLEPGKAKDEANALELAPRNVKASTSHSLKDELNEIEGILIQLLEPRLNKRGPNWCSTEEYIQDTSRTPYWSLDDSTVWIVSQLSSEITSLREELKRIKK